MVEYNLASLSLPLPPLPLLNFFVLHFPCGLCCQQLQADSLHVVEKMTGSLVFTSSDPEAERASLPASPCSFFTEGLQLVLPGLYALNPPLRWANGTPGLPGSARGPFSV